MEIVSTVFWIGETGCGPTNIRSAWDKNWVSSYGGVDDPVRRRGYGPAGFIPLENPFHVALPYCDMLGGRLKPEAAKVVPWFIERFRGLRSSVCRGHWLEIRHGVKTCYAQWEDVGLLLLNGNVQGGTFMDYRVPTAVETPRWERRSTKASRGSK
jgi:hypothetical protein